MAMTGAPTPIEETRLNVPYCHVEGGISGHAGHAEKRALHTSPHARTLAGVAAVYDVIRSIFIAFPPSIASLSALLRNGALRMKSMPTGQSNG